MSDRPARVRLMLDSGAFIGGLQTVAQQSESVGKRISKGLGGWGIAGLERLGGTLTGLGSKAMSAAKWGLALGGSFSLAEAAKDAMAMESTYKNIAFAIEASTGQATRWQAVQSSVKDAADKWANSDENVAAAMKLIHDETGDANFASGAISSVAKASLASQGAGKDMGILAVIAARVREQFGLMPSQMDDALASVIGLGAKGGVPLDDLAAKLGVVGAAAKAMGHKGKEGLNFALGMLSMAKESAGGMRKATMAATSFMEELGNAEKLKDIEKKLHIRVTSKKGEIAPDAIEKILVKTQGKPAELAKIFTGESWKLVTALGKPYAEAFAAAKGTKPERQQAALDAFHRAVQEAAKQTLSAADVEKEATKRLDSPKAMMLKALNELEDVFAQPEMMNALKTMARIAPKLADGLAKLLSFAVSEPWAAAAVAIPALIAKDFAAAGIGMAVKAALLALLPKVAVGAAAGDAAATGAGAAKGMAAGAVAGTAAKSAAPVAARVAGVAAGAVATMVAGALMTSGDEGTVEERRTRQKERHERAMGGATDRYSAAHRRAVEVIERRRAEQRGPEIERTSGPVAFPLPVTTSGGATELQRQGIRALNPEEVRAEGKAAARAHRDLATSAARAAQALDRIHTPPGQPPSEGGARGGSTNGLPPLAPRSPGYTPR
jgi:hypothetical protein